MSVTGTDGKPCIVSEEMIPYLMNEWQLSKKQTIDECKRLGMVIRKKTVTQKISDWCRGL